MSHERERITRTLDALTRGLYPFVEAALQSEYGEGWHDAARGSFRSDRGQRRLHDDVLRWDAHVLLTVMWDQWNRVFRDHLGIIERSLVSELREMRNRWAHQVRFSFDDAYRMLDSAERLLIAVEATEAAGVARDKRELLRNRFEQEARAAYKKTQLTKRKWQDSLIYLVCCVSIDYVILQSFGIQAWFFALFVVFVFAYLAWQRLVAPMQTFFGPHECDGCRKIIYGETCPYCESSPRSTWEPVVSSVSEPNPSPLPTATSSPRTQPVAETPAAVETKASAETSQHDPDCVVATSRV